MVSLQNCLTREWREDLRSLQVCDPPCNDITYACLFAPNKKAGEGNLAALTSSSQRDAQFRSRDAATREAELHWTKAP
jgi:hypothetical protein